MSIRKFAFWDKIKIFYSDYYLLTGTICFLFLLLILFVDYKKEQYRLMPTPELMYVEGKILDKKPDQVNHKNGFWYNIEYQVNAKLYRIKSFSNRNIDDKIRLKIKPSDPQKAVIDETLDFPFGERFLAYPVIALLTLVFLSKGLWTGFKNLNLLQYGELALGKFLYSEITNTIIEKKSVVKMYFSFTDKKNKVHQICVKTHLRDNLRDEPLEALLYMPKKPQEAVFVDVLNKIIRKKLSKEIERLVNKN